MPPKRKSNGKTPTKKGSKKSRKDSSSEHEASEGEETPEFDKSSLQRCVKFDFEELMNDPAFNHPIFVKTMEPEDLTVDNFEKYGLDYPIHFRCDPKRLGMTLPPSTFTVNDVLDLVGGNRMIEVVQVQDQGSVKMSLQEFVDFYNTPKEKRETLYNVLSLEFSLTPLEDVVKSPTLVRDIDWVGNKWPDALRQRWISFNGRDKKFYNPHHTFPKVQNYCLMSVANCYTDFHIDFSGTSVWYHVLKGKKVFWLIPPTETNFFIYQEFIKTVNDNAFFGKSVEKCHVAVLEPGDTMLIPSGWIHAVYTPDDSLVFGGNFLHSQSCKTQLRVYQVENKLNITRKFRLPYNEELLFYVIADYVKQWTGREYVRPLRIEDAKLDYVGEKWKAAGGHLRKIEYSDYETGVELTNDMVKEDEDVAKDEVKVIAMHAENSIFGHPMVSKSSFAYDTGLEEEAEDDVKFQETKEEMDARRDAEIDELANTNSLIFYKNSKHDFIRNKCVPDHKLPIGHEPPIYFNDDEVSKISPRLLEELEALGMYIRRKARVEVAEGICQPASLINAFNTVLRKRRAELEGKPFEFIQAMPRRYTRSTIETGEYDFQPVEGVAPEDSPRRSSRFKVEDFPDELLEPEEPVRSPIILPQQPSSGPLEYIPPPRIIKEDKNGFEEEYDEDYDENGIHFEEPEEDEDDDDEDEYEVEEYTPTPVTRRSSSRKTTGNAKLVDGETPVKPTKDGDVKHTKEEKESRKKLVKKKEKQTREQKKKELERRKLDSQLDAELRAAHGGGSAKLKKKKPAYVGGLPTAPIQNDPVVSNPYNYDPRMEMMKLGTGQLKSAYRKTKNNVELHIEKNLYKLEPKRDSHDGSESRELSIDPEHNFTSFDDINEACNDNQNDEEYADHKPPAKRAKYEHISVDTFEIPSSLKRKELRQNAYTSSSIASPSSSQPKQQHSSPATYSSSSESLSYKNKSSERRSIEASSAMKKGVYMPAMSRQDKMIAEAASASSSRHSSISSERRPSFIPDFNSSRNSSVDTPLYNATAPVPIKASWLPDTSTVSHSSVEEDSPIDVVNDSMSPIDVLNSPNFSAAITPPPVSLEELNNKELSNGRKSHLHHHSNHNDDGKRLRIPSKEAVAELKALVGRLNTVNDS